MTATDNSTTGVDPAVVAMMDAVFAEYREIHPDAADTVSRIDLGLWSQLAELGLVRLTGAESSGGSGASWYEAAYLHAAAVHHSVRTPLAEHDLLACWLLEANNMPVSQAVRTVCLLDAAGRANQVPWAACADRVVLIWECDSQSGIDYRIADVDPRVVTITPGMNTAGEPRDDVVADLASLDGVLVPAALITQLRLKSALLRALQTCAAMDRILELSIEHTTSRVQFGRPLSRFQAIQNMIADIAAEAAVARSATEAALAAAVSSDWTADSVAFLVAVARSCTGHAASAVVRNAHQVHGAIGTTVEHRLHEYTRAALCWRSEFGSVQSWDDKVTDAALAAGADGLWGLITG